MKRRLYSAVFFQPSALMTRMISSRSAATCSGWRATWTMVSASRSVVVWMAAMDIWICLVAKSISPNSRRNHSSESSHVGTGSPSLSASATALRRPSMTGWSVCRQRSSEALSSLHEGRKRETIFRVNTLG